MLNGQNLFVYLQVNPTYYVFDTLNSCDNQWYWIGDVCLHDSIPGDYQFVLQSTCGCDSVVNLHYTVNPSYWFELYDTIPRGTEYSANGFYFSAEETQNARQLERYNWNSTSAGCDSTCVLHLTLIGDVPIRYVAQNGTGDGRSWENAMGDLQAAMDSAALVQGDVWVAEGDYYGDGVSENAFTIQDGVHVFGGFAGNEPADYDLSLRNFNIHPTILDGQHVQRTVYHGWTWGQPPLMDGFTIQNGYSNSDDGGNVYGGTPWLQLTNCIVQGGFSEFDAGGAVNVIFRNSLIINNTSPYWGSALKDCNAYNCVITGNNANEYGYTTQWSTLTNCIIWNNIGNIEHGCSITYSAVEDQEVWGEGNIALAYNNDGSSPDSNYVRFVDPENGDFRLVYGSACINAGIQDISDLGLPSVDLQGLPRVLDGRIDMGAYEYYPVPVVETYDAICEGNSIVFFDSVYTVAGSYVHHTHAEDVTLDTLYVLNLAVNHATFGDTTAVACESFTWIDGETYTESTNEPTYTLTNAAGCDSVVTLNLTVNYGTHNAETEVACDSYEWHGETYTTSGMYTYEYTNADGCPSEDTLHLTINYSTTGIDEQVACESFTWIDGVTYTESTNTPTFTLTNVAGCDSVVTLNLTVNYGTHNTETEVACDSYEWNGETYSTSGMYTYEYTNADGCPSVDTLYLTINFSTTGIDEQTACESFTWIDGVTYTESTDTPTYTLTNAAGCDSVVTLNLTVNYGTHNIETEVACDSYEWNGETYTTTGVYTYEYTNADGCPSVDTLHLTINYSTTGIDEQTACEAFTWIDGVTYTESTNTPTFTLTNAAGCDSIVTLILTINSTYHEYLHVSACEEYVWNGETYLVSGDYDQTFTAANGCDSVVTLHLTVNYGTHNAETEVACDSYEWNGETYTTSGTYTYEYTNADGCPSVDTLHLTINNSTTSVDEQTACDSFTWIDGVTYTESTNTPTFTLMNAAGCDSVVTLNLTVNYGTHNVETEVACDSYEWYGESYSTSGTYTYEYTNADGCPSVDTLYLTINNSTTGIDEQTACESFTWIDGVTYTESTNTPTFTLTNAAGCDSVVTLNLTIYESTTSEFTITTPEPCYTWNDMDYCESGDYTQTLQTVHGCDSIVTLHLTITVGIDDHETVDFKVFPNPTTGVVNVECTMNDEQLLGAEIQVVDMYGKLVRTVETHGRASLQGTIDISDLAAGVYFVKAVMDGKVIAVRKVVKE